MIMPKPLDVRPYPIADSETVPTGMGSRSNVRAVPTGEFRNPRRGEWYLSGAIIEAYQAPNTLTTMSFHIARLVTVIPNEAVFGAQRRYTCAAMPCLHSPLSEIAGGSEVFVPIPGSTNQEARHPDCVTQPGFWDAS